MFKLTTDQQIVYVCRDPERALGIIPQKSYCIITNAGTEGKRLANGSPFVHLISAPKTLSTLELLQHPTTSELLKTMNDPKIVVFKNTHLIENFCQQKGWKLLNPSAALAAKVEEKISQLEWLGDLQKYLPDHSVMLGKQLTFENILIAQFNRAHTGEGTLLLDSEQKVEELKTKFPERPLRLTKYIEGASYTCNNVVFGDQILNGPISYQITGITPFTNNTFATVGNDWHYASTHLTSEQKNSIYEIANAVGKKLAFDGWKGLFGIDCMVEEETGKVYLIEINARQPASTTYESSLQTGSATTFESHLAALLNLPLEESNLPELRDGAQIIYRLPTNGVSDLENKIKKLTDLGLKIFQYDESTVGKDLLRIQCKTGIIEHHNRLNELGKKIQEIIA